MTARLADAALVARPATRRLAAAAVAALHGELVLAPKPGLVCPHDAGSHADMDATTMLSSLFVLRHGFVRLADAGARDAPFATLQGIGRDAEAAMLRRTAGVNTHRGAIFTLGLLVAAAGRAAACSGPTLRPADLRATLLSRWGDALARGPARGASHGLAMAARHGAGGARAEAARGFPTVFDVALPALQAARAAGHDERGARLHALMTAMATVEDTNLLYRGGVDGLAFARAAAQRFLDRGGVARPDRDDALRAIGASFVARRLSPGGSADLLAAALFVDRVTR